MFDLERLNEPAIETQPERVQRMFGSIARRYYLANHLLSCGADFYWRNRAAEIVANWRSNKVVDLATGTGDLALAIAKKLPSAEITGLEFSLPRLSILRTVYRFYLHRCLPLLGSFLTQQKRAYHYLGGSIEEFPSDGAMVRLIEASGFANATAEPLTGGIATIYIAIRKKAL